MKILFMSEFYWPQIGGIEVLSKNMLKIMHRDKGYEFVIITSKLNKALPDQEKIDNTLVYRFPFYEIFAKNDLRLIGEIQKKIIEIKKSFKPDLIHLNNFQGLSAYFQLRTQNIAKCPLLVVLHSVTLQKLSQNTVAEKIFTSADKIISVSNKILNDVLLNYYPKFKSKSQTIYNGLNMPDIKPAVLSKNPMTLLCLGRVIIQKGFDIAIKAFAKLLVKFPNLRLIIAGDGVEKNKLEIMVQNLNISHAVKFMGWVNPDKVPELINQSSMVIMPSRWEPFGLVALQAGQMGRPLIGTAVDGLPEVVIDKETGLLVESENSDALADAITLLLENSALAEEMGKTARNWVEKKFNIEAVVEQYDRVYQELYEKKFLN